MRVAIYLMSAFVGALLGVTADAASPYDGTYVGTSLAFTGTTNSGKGNVCTTTATAPAPLTIANGHAQTKWGTSALEGEVDASGKLVMHSTLTGRFEGQIDATGVLKGNFQGNCIFALAWKRRG
jgi:hypothetical protein